MPTPSGDSFTALYGTLDDGRGRARKRRAARPVSAGSLAIVTGVRGVAACGEPPTDRPGAADRPAAAAGAIPRP